MEKSILRIGNIIHYKDLLLQVYELTDIVECIELQSGKTLGISYKEARPVILNHDLLERFGFKKADYISNYSLYWLERQTDGIGSISVSLHADFCRFNLVDREIRVIRSVNELQNLFWAISDKELEFNNF